MSANKLPIAKAQHSSEDEYVPVVIWRIPTGENPFSGGQDFWPCNRHLEEEIRWNRKT
jgi:hypothetical protein